MDGNIEQDSSTFAESIQKLITDADADRSLGELLELHEEDESSEGVQVLRAQLDGLTCRDLQQLLDCESFKPQLYTTFIKLINEM